MKTTIAPTTRSVPHDRNAHVVPPRSDLCRQREFCYREACREFFGEYRTVIVDTARNGKVVCVQATCHGADYVGADTWWWGHLAGGAL